MERLDKRVSNYTQYSRKDVKALVREGRIVIDGELAKAFNQQISESSIVEVDGKRIWNERRIVGVMNKPMGYVTSTSDPSSPTVMSLVPDEWKVLKVFPVGRLDKDTEGLLIFTNDGDLAHRIISPKKQIEKEYYVEHLGEAKDEDVDAFKKGIVLKNGEECLPSLLIPEGNGKSRVIITEGKYHQVRRMMASMGLNVIYLERIREGNITLSSLKRGECRELSPQEIERL